MLNFYQTPPQIGGLWRCISARHKRLALGSEISNPNTSSITFKYHDHILILKEPQKLPHIKYIEVLWFQERRRVLVPFYDFYDNWLKCRR